MPPGGSPSRRLWERIRALYGPGEPRWLERQLGRLPESVARVAVRFILGVAAARRRIVFDNIFGMREAA